MDAKSSDLSDKMSEANLQADGQAEKPAHRAVDRWEMEEEDSSPHNSLMWSPCPVAAIGLPQYETLLKNTGDF